MNNSPEEGQNYGYKGHNDDINTAVQQAHGQGIADARHHHLGLNHVENLHTLVEMQSVTKMRLCDISLAATQ